MSSLAPDGGTGPASLNPWDMEAARMLDRIWDGEHSSCLFSLPKAPLSPFPPRTPTWGENFSISVQKFQYRNIRVTSLWNLGHPPEAARCFIGSGGNSAWIRSRRSGWGMRLCPGEAPREQVWRLQASHQNLAKLGFPPGRAKDFWNEGFPPFPSQWEALPCLAAWGVILRAE